MMMDVRLGILISQNSLSFVRAKSVNILGHYGTED